MRGVREDLTETTLLPFRVGKVGEGLNCEVLLVLLNSSFSDILFGSFGLSLNPHSTLGVNILGVKLGEFVNI